ncbi:MAG: hypothetical protein JNM41_13755, partial [Flavipsychrobacter sp.]|nr:hypothetical protein [Flavipsychrobacter sp.]
MKSKYLLLIVSLYSLNSSISFAQHSQASGSKGTTDGKLEYADERHFKNMRQLTFGGDNAEAYFGFDNRHVTFQRTSAPDGVECDQIFYGTIPGKKKKEFKYDLVSTGKGRTTCAYLLPDMKHILYASTHEASTTCPPVPHRSKVKKYVWHIYEGYDINVADLKGNITGQITKS